MKTLKWILIVYLAGWFCVWALSKAMGRERLPIPGVTRKTSELDFRPLSSSEALVARTAKVRYNLIVSAEFPWFLPKSHSVRCGYDNIADNRGLRVSREGESDLRVSCQGPGRASLACADSRWVITCDGNGEMRMREEAPAGAR
ncbi:MAG: hypothetical protein JWP91_872 [Fibrobacteres bacterium]|nr:hypothetical protein [Fibrobacterota bacterium]